VSAERLEAVELEPHARADAAVVWLHGLGADGHDFASLVPELRLPAEPAVRFVLPHAPIRPVTINGGYRMRAWYDIAGFDRGAPQDESGIRASAEAIGALVRRERERGVPSERIVLAGFSQGAAMALHLGPRWPERLGGVIGLSGYLPLADTVAREARPENTALPVFLAHGSLDEVVPQAAGLGTRDALRALGYAVEWRSYAMGHSVCAQEIDDVREWLLRCLPPRRA
jgi:phospholipase/carboxylesterase